MRSCFIGSAAEESGPTELQERTLGVRHTSVGYLGGNLKEHRLLDVPDCFFAHCCRLRCVCVGFCFRTGSGREEGAGGTKPAPVMPATRWEVAESETKRSECRIVNRQVTKARFSSEQEDEKMNEMLFRAVREDDGRIEGPVEQRSGRRWDFEVVEVF